MVECTYHGREHEPWQCPGLSPIEKRAQQLQAGGPDEYPWGYYMYLAREQMREELEKTEDRR